MNKNLTVENKKFVEISIKESNNDNFLPQCGTNMCNEAK